MRPLRSLPVARALIASVCLASGSLAHAAAPTPVAPVPPAAPATPDPSGGCPIALGELDAIVAAMQGKSCMDAKDLAERCALGASGDVVTAGAASAICQKDFAKKPADQKLFAALRARCNTKFVHEDGTMYRSAAAFCVLEVAALLSGLNQPVDHF